MRADTLKATDRVWSLSSNKLFKGKTAFVLAGDLSKRSHCRFKLTHPYTLCTYPDRIVIARWIG
jgi:hypothetical protein